MLVRSRKPKIEIRWCVRPRRKRHDFLGIKSVWFESERRYQIIRFSEGIKDYGVYRFGIRITERRSLAGAKRAALLDLRSM